MPEKSVKDTETKDAHDEAISEEETLIARINFLKTHLDLLYKCNPYTDPDDEKLSVSHRLDELIVEYMRLYEKKV